MSLKRVTMLCVLTPLQLLMAQVTTPYSQLVEQALTIVREHALHSDRLDWPSIESDIRKEVKTIQMEPELYWTLQHLLDHLDDQHSFLITADGDRWLTSSPSRNFFPIPPLPKPEMNAANIAYIKIGPMSSRDDAEMQQYASSLYNSIVSAYHENLRGWILDFRDNTGGQLWPMLAGLSPLINADTAGIAVYPNGNGWYWWAKNGASGVMSNTHFRIGGAQPVNLPELPIVILISGRTASSGEASVISFIGRDNIRLFGRPTHGLATINQPYKLDNGATLMLTSGWFGDRNGVTYPDGIGPDIVFIIGASTIYSEKDFEALHAIEWLTKQPDR